MIDNSNFNYQNKKHLEDKRTINNKFDISPIKSNLQNTETKKKWFLNDSLSDTSFK